MSIILSQLESNFETKFNVISSDMNSRFDINETKLNKRFDINDAKFDVLTKSLCSLCLLYTSRCV